MKLPAMAACAAFSLAAGTAASPAPIGTYQMSYPFPSPDGKSVVFQGDLDGRWQLYEMNLADGTTRRLHVSDKDDTHPALSPDGRMLAFISNRDGNDEVYTLDLEAGTARSVSPHPGKDGHPKWSGDGRWIVFNRTFDPSDKGGDGDSAIMRVRSDGSGLEKISDTGRVETFPSFSPDARRIVLVEWFPNAAGDRNRNGELVVVDIASGTRRNITNSDRFDAYPYWGASGSWIYFSTAATGPSGPEVAAHRIRPDGTGLERLTPLDGASEVRAIPSANEKTLYFNVASGGRTLVHALPIAP